MTQTDVSSSHTPGEEGEESRSSEPAVAPSSTSAADAPPINANSSTPMTPRLVEEPDEESEKDAQDRLTPAAMVHAASGIQLQRVVQNASDLKEDDAPEKDFEQLDKVLAAVPPTLERQPAVASQPGAYRAGGAPHQDDASVMSGATASVAGATGLVIEATLVEEGAAPVPVMPIYKGQIVEERDDDDASADHTKADNVVTLSKRQVRCFLAAFAFVIVVAIALGIGLTFDEIGRDSVNNPEEDRESQKGYWYQDTPEDLSVMLQGRQHITHHMALVSIVNPNNIAISSSEDNAENATLTCSPLRDEFEKRNESSNNDRQRYLRQEGRNRDGSDSSVMVSFTCGFEQSESPRINGDPKPYAVILVHDENAKALNGDRGIKCKDATNFPNDTLKYNEVFCEIPINYLNDWTDPLAFFFSCFSLFEQETVASVHMHDFSAECGLAYNITLPFNSGQPTFDIKPPPAIVLSTQRLCRSYDDVQLQGDILEDDWGRNTLNCSNGWPVEDDLFVCVGASNDTVSPANVSPCSDGLFPLCFEIQLPNVTISDRWDDDARKCSYKTIQESLVQKVGGSLPSLVPLNNATLLDYIRQQKNWVQQWHL